MDYPISKLASIALALLWCAPAPLSAAPGDDQYAVAAGHYTRSRWDLAAEEFRSLLTEYPEHSKAASARFYLGEALVQVGQFEPAHAAFAQFLTDYPDEPRFKQALFRAGETSYLAGKPETAAGELSQFAERYPTDELNAYVVPYLGDLALKAKEWSAARRYYERALKEFPAGPLANDCRYSLGRALERLDQRSAAEGLYAEVAATPSNELSLEARYQLGSAQYARGDYAAAAATLAEFAEAAADHPWYEQARLAEGWSRYRLKDYPQAEQVFAHLVTSSTYGLEARYWLGLTQKAQGDWSTAATTLQAAAADAGSQPLAPTLRFHAGEALLKAGQAKEADAQFAQLLVSYPDCEWVDASWLGRARAALATGNHALVDHHAAHFAEHGQNSDKRWGVNRVRADSLIARKDYSNAIGVLETLVSQDPDPAAAASHQLALAVAYLGSGQADDALALVENLPSAAAPEVLGESKLTRAQALVALRRFAEALPLVEERLTDETDPARRAVCRAQLAICLARTGNLPRAKQEYQQLAGEQPEAELLAATTGYLVDAARDAGDRVWSDELLTRVTSQRMPAGYAAAALATRGWDEYQQGEYEQAAATLERLMTQYPSHPSAPQAALSRGQALEQLDQPDAALAAYQWLLTQHGNCELAPKAWLATARLHDRQQRDNEAATCYERLVADYPQLAERDAVLYEWAWLLGELHRPDDAAKRYEQLRSEFPQSPLLADATFRLAELASERQEYERAAELLAEIATADAEPALQQHILYAQGQLAAKRQRWAEVSEPLRRLQREFPDSVLRLLADYWLAEAEYRQQNYDRAAEQFALLSEQTAGRTESWVALTALRRAQLAARREDWLLAHELAAAIAVDFPQFEQQYEADYVLGRSLAGQALFQEAREAYRRVLQSETGGKTETAAMAQWMTGETFLHQKDYRAALREFLRLEILYAYPTWQAGALLQAGKCQELLGQPEQAAEFYTRIVKEFPESEFAAEAGERLEAVAAAAERSADRSRQSLKGSRS